MSAFSGGPKHRSGTVFVLSIFLLLCIFGPCSSRPSLEDYNDDFDENYEKEEDKSNDELLADALKYLPKNGELFEGDIIMDNRLRRAVYGEKSKKSYVKDAVKWPGGIVPYEIDEKFPQNQRELLKEAFKEYHDRTCIKFVPRDDFLDDNYVVFTNKSDECSSNIGMSGGQQFINLGKNCGILGTYLHECMHTLGFIHEHSRPDRDDYIKVRFENIKKDQRSNFMKYSMDEVNSFQPLNFASMMMYRNNAFTKNGKDTIQSLEEPDLKFGQRLKFSAGDVLAINKLYNCQKQLDDPNYHHLYAAFHTKSRKRKKKKRDGLGTLIKKVAPIISSWFSDEVMKKKK